jgi:hypothetical protein
MFWEVVGLERGPLSIVNTTLELLGRISSGSGLESREYGLRDLSRWPRGTLYPQKLALTSPTSSGLPVGIVRSLAKATKSLLHFIYNTAFSLLGTLVLIKLEGWGTSVQSAQLPTLSSRLESLESAQDKVPNYRRLCNYVISLFYLFRRMLLFEAEIQDGPSPSVAVTLQLIVVMYSIVRAWFLGSKLVWGRLLCGHINICRSWCSLSSGYEEFNLLA